METENDLSWYFVPFFSLFLSNLTTDTDECEATPGKCHKEAT